MLNGCFKILNIAIDENAFSASNTFSLFENTYIKKETADTLLIDIINYLKDFINKLSNYKYQKWRNCPTQRS